jgi:hypothetical protein
VGEGDITQALLGVWGGRQWEPQLQPSLATPFQPLPPALCPVPRPTPSLQQRIWHLTPLECSSHGTLLMDSENIQGTSEGPLLSPTHSYPLQLSEWSKELMQAWWVAPACDPSYSASS